MAALAPAWAATAPYVSADDRGHGICPKRSGPQPDEEKAWETVGGICLTVVHFLTNRMALSLARHAAKVAPPHRAEWFEAMINEINHLPRGASGARWAFGCVFVSYTERIAAMARSTTSFSRWILSLEMMICFVPLTFLLLAIVLRTTRGAMSVRDGLFFCSIAVVGPMGLAAAFSVLFLKRRSLNFATTTLLGGVAAWTVIGYSSLVFNVGDWTHLFEFWREFLLIAVFPAMAALHLIQMARSERDSVTAEFF
jgi:hypothetical protein